MAKANTTPQDGQGELAETIFKLAISRGYLFRPAQLGDKWPISDFYVELMNTNEKLFFIVQVKSSSKTLGIRSKKLSIKIAADKISSLANYHAPTYIAGVDITTEKVYLTAVNSVATHGMSSMESKFDLDSMANLQLLYDDVKAFWTQSKLMSFKSSFQHGI